MKRRYTIYDLLKKQPISMKKIPFFKNVLELYSSSGYLKGLHFNIKCYTLLNKAKIPPENLNHFYRIYRLKAHPFFPLFLKTKTEFINHQLEKKHSQIVFALIYTNVLFNRNKT